MASSDRNRPLPRRILGLAVAASLLFAGVSGSARAQTAESMLNRPAPVFVRSGPGGARVDLAQDRGRVVLLNFWATWCAPCRTEMPRFAAWQKEYGPRGLRVVGVSIDDSEPPVRAFLEKLPVDYPVVMGDRALAEQYGGVLGVPVTFLIDRRGIIRGRFEGETDLRALETRMRRLLDSGSP